MGFFITEGGVAGHMNHLYDNPELTFKKMKEICVILAEDDDKDIARVAEEIFSE